MTFLEPLITQGSLIGLILLLYATCVSAMCSNKARHSPYELSVIERSPLNTLVALASIPMGIWTLIYTIGHLGIIKGITVWVVTGILTTIAIKITGFSSIPGLHLIAASISIIIGTILTIRTHPF
jgi:hypothetical protein